MRPSISTTKGLAVVVAAALLAAACGTDDDATEPAQGNGDEADQDDSGDGFTIGYAGLSSEFPFVADVNDGLEVAAQEQGLDLIVLDNKYDPQEALTNADTLILQQSDVIIEFQTDADIAPALCQKFDEAGLGGKVIAIDIPHPPCAIFFGADNAFAGELAGENLARVAQERWGGVDKLVLLELPQSGELVRSRTDSYVDGVRSVFPDFDDADVIKVDGEGALESSLTAMQNVLPSLTDADRILVGAVNDPSAVGALRAIQAADREEDFLIGGQNATDEARTELCAASETFIGTVGYFPERYGASLVTLAEQLFAGEQVPDEVYIDHEWIDADTINDYYPC